MDRGALKLMLDEGLSLAEIARRSSLHESTVGYWVEKHGLRAVNRDRHAARGGLSKVDLGQLIAGGASIAVIAQTLGRSKTAIRHWLARYGLRTTAKAGARAREGTREAKQAGSLEAELACPRHGRVRHVRESRGYYRCHACRQESVVRRRRKVKETLVSEAGGRCQLCGYDRCLAALEFHHLDPSAKKFGVAQDGFGRGIERLRAEARKCILLCATCHAEVEAGITRLPPRDHASLQSHQDLEISPG